MAEGSKYKIKIVRMGVGDPENTINFEFTGEDEGYTIPSANDACNISVQFFLCNSCNNECTNYNTDVYTETNWYSLGRPTSAGPFEFSFTFYNTEQYETGDVLYSYLLFIGDDGVEFHPYVEGEENLTSDANAYQQKLNKNMVDGDLVSPEYIFPGGEEMSC